MRTLLLLLAVAAAQEPPPPVPMRAIAATVHVRVDQSPVAPELDRLYRWLDVAGPGVGRPHTATGSAVIVGDPPVVLTNHHVVAGARSVVVEDGNDTVLAEIPATRVAVDARADLAVLRLPTDRPWPAVRLAARDADGTRVHLLGFPADGPLAITAGVLGGARDQAFGGVPSRALRLTTAQVRRGASGGPAIDGNGALVGLTVAGSEATSDLAGQGLLVPLARVRDAVARLDRGCADADLGARLTVTADGLRVDGVWPDGAADRAGVHAGDVVQSVDGLAARDAWDMLGPCASPTTWTLADGRAVVLHAEPRPPGDLLGVADDGTLAVALGAAWRLGLDAGDRITHVGGVPVGDTAKLREALGRRDGPVTVSVAGKGLVILPAR